MGKQDFLGKRLVEEGIITQAQLEEALQNQELKKGDKGLVGRILVRLGYCTEEDIARIIAKRAQVDFVSLEKNPADSAAMSTVSVETIQRYKALPIAFENDKLVVAMQHPSDILALDDLRILTGYTIKPVVVTDSELEEQIKSYGRVSVGVEQSTDEKEENENSEEEDGADLSAALEGSPESPAVQLANVIMAQAVSAKASDVHIEPFEKMLKVRFRIDGVLHDIMHPPRQVHGPLISRIKIMSNIDIAERRKPQDGRMTMKVEGKSIDVRVATLPASHGERVTLRLLERSEKTVTLDELGLEPEMKERFSKAINSPYGFILVTGPTGSGKSTTLYASLDTVDKEGKNVITVEDPVEYRMEGINQIQVNPKAGLTFASGLRSILRSDPDIVMIGEIRDKDTARIAIESALTGHLVFSTLHTNDAAGAISRLAEMEVEPYLTASSLICVLAQRLVRVLCSNCKEKYEISREEAQQVAEFPLQEGEEKIIIYRGKPKGCIKCSSTGYKGRVGIYEMLFVTEEIQRLTLANKSAGEIKKTAMNEGMQSLRQNGFLKVRHGITSMEEVLRVIL